MSTIKVDTLQTRAGSTAAVTGAGFVATDQIRGNTAANSVTVVAEGGTNTTNLQQGLAKSWINFNGTGTIAARDSFNHSSLTDASAGNHTVTMASAMGNVNYSFTGGVAESNASSASRVVNFGSNFDSGTLDPNFTTTAYSVNTFFCNSDGQEFDVTFISNQIFGDLA